MGKKVMLSQCMIVKNEEKNIEKALSWGKNIVFEQIVVDTGSTDQTVEIAERMGAKVYHFPWIDDFSAAKNFAIDKASGNWIAFLDADEYFLKEDAEKLTKLLDELEKNKSSLYSIACGWAHLDDEGVPYSMGVQTRIFRNAKELRYHNRIHEQIQLESGELLRSVDATKSITIQHTGYSSSAYIETDKLKRNIYLLRKELKENPSNIQTVEYLAESLFADGQNNEAEALFEQHLSQMKGEKTVFRQDVAFYGLMQILVERDGADDALKIEELYHKFKQTNSLHPDVYYWMGVWKSRHKVWKESIACLNRAFENLKLYNGLDSVYLLGSLEHGYYLLATAYQEIGDNASAVKYCTLALRSDPYSERVLLPLLTMFKQDNYTSTKDIITFLGKLYNITQLKNKMFLYKCAKKLSYIELEDHIFQLLSEEEKKWFNRKDTLITELSKEEWAECYPEIKCINKFDQEFLLYMDKIKETDSVEFNNVLKRNLIVLEQNHKNNYQNFVNYFSQFTFWGRLLPKENVYEVLERRVTVLKEHVQDFVWLYGKFVDYRSKKTLWAILKNWITMETEPLSNVKEHSEQYFDLDIIGSGQDEVIADLGAYTGDTFQTFIDTYGETYKRYYCYEISPEPAAMLRRNTRKYQNVVICQKAAGSEDKMMSLKENSFDSGNSLSESEMSDSHNLVRMVAIDEDISEPLTFIKMDIEGAEADALKGCRRQITENHPKLAISVYHGYDDLWRLPRMIDEIAPGYRFYLRYYGGDLIPTEIVLYALYGTE